MKKKQQKLPKLNSEHKEALAELSVKPEFKALERLFRIEENNIVIKSFTDETPDPVAAAVRKAWFKGRLYELRMILKTFEKVRKPK